MLPSSLPSISSLCALRPAGRQRYRQVLVNSKLESVRTVARDIGKMFSPLLKKIIMAKRCITAIKPCPFVKRSGITEFLPPMDSFTEIQLRRESA
jgi:hypothetical protein